MQTAGVIIFLAFAGGAIAFLSTILGIGGGVFTVPLLFFLGKKHIPHEQLGLLAISGSLLLAFLFSASATYQNRGHKQIAFPHSLLMIGGAIPGANLATHWTTAIETSLLLSIFGGFLLLNGSYAALRLFLRKYRRSAEKENPPRKPPGTSRGIGLWTALLLLFSGLGVGLLSGFTGVGGGIVIVPLFLNVFGMSPRQAVASSTFCIVFVTLSGLLAYHIESLGMEVLIPEPRIGFLYLPFMIPLAIGGILGGYAGSQFTRKIPSFYLSLLIVILQLAIAGKILL